MAATLDALAGEADGVRIVRRGGPPDPPQPDRRRAPLELGRRRRACSPTPRPPPSARASCASSLPRRRAGAGHLHRRGRAHGAGLRRALGRAGLAPVGRALRLRGAGRAGRGPLRQPHPLRLAGAAGERRARRVEGSAKTSIVFWGFNDASPGALVEVLRELSDRDINLTKIESRPRRVRARPLHVLRRPRRPRAASRTWRRRWRRCGKRVETLRVLGSYPAWTAA